MGLFLEPFGYKLPSTETLSVEASVDDSVEWPDVRSCFRSLLDFQKVFMCCRFFKPVISSQPSFMVLTKNCS